MSLEDLGDFSQVSVARVQEESGCRLHIERASNEVRIFGPKSDILVADRIIKELSLLCAEEHVLFEDLSLLNSPVLESLAHACNVTFRIHDRGISVLGLKPAVIKAAQEVRLFNSAPQSYKITERPLKKLPPPAVPQSTVQQLQPDKAQLLASPYEDGVRDHSAAKPLPLGQDCGTRHDGVCPTCHSTPYCTQCGAVVWCTMPPPVNSNLARGFNQNQACYQPQSSAMPYQFVLMRPMEVSQGSDAPQRNMGCMIPTGMMPMCMPMMPNAQGGCMDMKNSERAIGA